MKSIYQMDDVHAAMEKVCNQGSDSNHALVSLYRRMHDAGPDRFVVKPAGMPDFEGLRASLPNFSDVLDQIKNAIALCLDSPDPMEIQPILLLGPPGVGKTHFGRTMAQLMGTGFHMIPMASTTAGFVLGGASSQWKSAKPGRVFDAFMSDKYANPLFLIDEIDKARGEFAYDPLGALYSLFEHDTAAFFRDEFAEVDIDATAAIFIATCNDERDIPEPILNRMNVFEIKSPDDAQSARIALLVYQNIRDAHAWGSHFPPDPKEDVLSAFADITPRQMRRDITTAFGNAKLAKRAEVTLADVPHRSNGKKSPMGFST